MKISPDSEHPHLPVSWEEAGPDEFMESCLLSVLYFNGVPHHLEAVAVVEQEVEGGGTVQVAAHDQYSCRLEGLDVFEDSSGPFWPVKIEGYEDHDYILTVTPMRR